MSRIFNRYSNQLAILVGVFKHTAICISLGICLTPIFVFSQSLPVIDNSNDLLGLSPLSINNYVQCTIKYLQNSSNLIKVVQEKNNRISFYQKSLKELIEIYNKLYDANELNEAQELIQLIQKIRIFSSRLSQSLEIGINLNKQLVRETQKKPCNLNSLLGIQNSQSNIISQSNDLEKQLSNNLENAYRLIGQTQFKKSQQLISDLNSSSSLGSSSSSSLSSSSSSDSSTSSVSSAMQNPTPKVDQTKSQPNPSQNNSSQGDNPSTSQASINSSSSISSSSDSSTSASDPISSSSISSSASNPPQEPIIESSSSSSQSEPSTLVPDEDLGNLANERVGIQSSSGSGATP